MEGKWKTWHSWSRSRQSLFEICPRKYYYQYVKAYDLEYGDILNVTKRKLKDMNEIRFLEGNTVHDAIKHQFDQLSRGRGVSGPKNALEYVSRYINEIKEEPSRYIIEASNKKKITEEEIYRIEKEIERKVKIFFNEFFDYYKDLEIIKHEEYCNVELDGYKFWLIPDLVTKSKDGTVYISDWKTNSSYSDAMDDHQMKLYILWALEEGISDLDNLRAEVVFLDIGESKEFKTTQEELDTFKNGLVTKSKELYECIDSKSGETDFPKCEDEEVCISCGFKAYCEVN
ncbi:MAG: PD-(D/E)XK nuclease family protein [Halobacteriota archaeon]|nr:PD-(D/E)XK nuclease family protein [Halobacteriota archaeon]